MRRVLFVLMAFAATAILLNATTAQAGEESADDQGGNFGLANMENSRPNIELRLGLHASYRFRSFYTGRVAPPEVPDEEADAWYDEQERKLVPALTAHLMIPNVPTLTPPWIYGGILIPSRLKRFGSDTISLEILAGLSTPPDASSFLFSTRCELDLRHLYVWTDFEIWTRDMTFYGFLIARVKIGYALQAGAESELWVSHFTGDGYATVGPTLAMPFSNGRVMLGASLLFLKSEIEGVESKGVFPRFYFNVSL